MKSETAKTYFHPQQLYLDMDKNIIRYPLPICFDAGEEQRALYRRQPN